MTSMARTHGAESGSRHLLPGLPPPTLRPVYTMTELVRYAKTSRSTARAWLRGYEYRTIGGPRAARPAAGNRGSEELLTFYDLVEVAAIAAARRVGVPLQRLRTAIDAGRNLYGWERPLVMERFKHDGHDIFVQDPDSGQPVNLSRWVRSRRAHIREVLKDLDYETEMAARWWPAGRDGGILVDPAVSFGRPVIEPSGVSTIAVLERWRAGELIEELAEDYGIPPSRIESALRYEQDWGRAA